MSRNSRSDKILMKPVSLGARVYTNKLHINISKGERRTEGYLASNKTRSRGSAGDELLRTGEMERYSAPTNTNIILKRTYSSGIKLPKIAPSEIALPMINTAKGSRTSSRRISKDTMKMTLRGSIDKSTTNQTPFFSRNIANESDSGDIGSQSSREKIKKGKRRIISRNPIDIMEERERATIESKVYSRPESKTNSGYTKELPDKIPRNVYVQLLEENEKLKRMALTKDQEINDLKEKVISRESDSIPDDRSNESRGLPSIQKSKSNLSFNFNINLQNPRPSSKKDKGPRIMLRGNDSDYKSLHKPKIISQNMPYKPKSSNLLYRRNLDSRDSEKMLHQDFLIDAMNYMPQKREKNTSGVPKFKIDRKKTIDLNALGDNKLRRTTSSNGKNTIDERQNSSQKNSPLTKQKRQRSSFGSTARLQKIKSETPAFSPVPLELESRFSTDPFPDIPEHDSDTFNLSSNIPNQFFDSVDTFGQKTKVLNKDELHEKSKVRVNKDSLQSSKKNDASDIFNLTFRNTNLDESEATTEHRIDPEVDFMRRSFKKSAKVRRVNHQK